MAASKPRGHYVALLRGVNVSGKNKLPMAARLGTTSTLRNWNTVTRLVEMVGR
jgi:uncharacterized protein (DUF1697 family)